MEIYKSFNDMAVGTGALAPGSISHFEFVDNMSPTIDQFTGYGIQIFANDHEPPHVQIRKGDLQVGKLPIRVEDTCSLTYQVEGIPHGDLRKLKRHVKENADYYMEKWKEYHGEGET